MNEITLTHDAARLYLRYWTVALGYLLGWSQERVVEWAKQREALLNDESSMLYHEFPTYLVTSLLVPPAVKERLVGTSLMDLYRRIEAAIALNEYSDEAFQRYDWDAAVRRIDAILDEFGESFENVRNQQGL